MKKILLCLTVTAVLLQSAAYAADLSSWAETEYTSANSVGLVSFNVVKNNMQDNITRGEFCDLAVNLYKSLTGETIYTPEIYPFEDCNSDSIAQAYELGIVSGVSDTEFMPDSPITREQISKILVSTLLKSDINVTLNSADKNVLKPFTDADDIHDWAKNSIIVLLKENILNGISDTTISPLGNATREQAIALANRTYKTFSAADNTIKIPSITNIKDGAIIDGDLTCSWNANSQAKEYRLILKDGMANAKIVYTTKKQTATIPASKLEKGQKYSVILQTTLSDNTKVFSVPIDITIKQTATPAPTTNTSSAKKATTEKELRIFESGYYFTSKDEAQKYMTDITVDVWKINSSGEKYASTLNLTVHRALADDIKKIFSEIFNDSEQFPIKSAGCFQWRNSASGRLSQHSYGTCIDINPTENYYVSKTGAALSGSYWKPGEDPYSVTEDGIVVKTFAKYGFLWGGNAWGENSAKDYMHFTYLGN